MEKYKIDFGEGKSYIFTRKGKKAVNPWKDHMWFVNADVKAADGTMFDAVIGIDVESSGEHWGTMILLDRYIADQGDEDFLEKIEKTREEFFPYKYRYRKELPCGDFHIGDDGWS